MDKLCCGFSTPFKMGKVSLGRKTQIKLSVSSQDGVIGTASHLKPLNNQTKYRKQWFSRHWTSGNKQTVVPGRQKQVPECPRLQGKEGDLPEPGGFRDLRRWSGSPGRPGQLECAWPSARESWAETERRSARSPWNTAECGQYLQLPRGQRRASWRAQRMVPRAPRASAYSRQPGWRAPEVTGHWVGNSRILPQ